MSSRVKSVLICEACNQHAGRLTRGRCGACYMRLRRGKPGLPRRPAMAPELQAIMLPVPGTTATFAARVFGYVDTDGDCWEWTGTLDTNGYGVIGRGKRGSGNIPAHCAVWELLVGPIPKGMQYDHRCRYHACVNPDHGEIVTPQENKRRGYSVAQLHAKRTRCPEGHPFDGVLGGRGGKRQHRYCKTCKRADSNRRYHASRARGTHELAA